MQQPGQLFIYSLWVAWAMTTCCITYCMLVQDLQELSSDLARLQEATNSYVCVVDDLQTNYDSNYSRLEDYQLN